MEARRIEFKKTKQQKNVRKTGIIEEKKITKGRKNKKTKTKIRIKRMKEEAKERTKKN